MTKSREDNIPGSRIRKIRESAGRSQQDVADAADIRQPTLSAIERGESVPGLDTLRNIAKVLGTTVGELAD